jgi:hypothetical protein
MGILLPPDTGDPSSSKGLEALDPYVIFDGVSAAGRVETFHLGFSVVPVVTDMSEGRLLRVGIVGERDEP